MAKKVTKTKIKDVVSPKRSKFATLISNNGEQKSLKIISMI